RSSSLSKRSSTSSRHGTDCPPRSKTPVDVREATGLQRLRAKDPVTHALVVAHGRPEFQEPQWSDEREAATGRKLEEGGEAGPAEIAEPQALVGDAALLEEELPGGDGRADDGDEEEDEAGTEAPGGIGRHEGVVEELPTRDP